MDTDMPEYLSQAPLDRPRMIDLLWADCDLDAQWIETHEELNWQWEHRLAA
jgi:hypothetical protein